MSALEHDPLLPRPATTATPLPKTKLAAVFAIKLLIPVTSTQLSPYVNRMVESMLPVGEGEKVGYYSGLVLSSLMFAQMLSMYPWAQLSDRFGRKPVVLMGGVGIAISTVVFGLSRSIWGVVVAAFFCGLSCGTTGAIHAVVGELSDETNQSTIFPLYDIITALGYIVGPLIGGTFADPVNEHPSWPWSHFGFRKIFKIYPLAFSVLEETHPSRRKATSDTAPVISLSASNGSFNELAPDDTKYVKNKGLSAFELLTIPVVRSICGSSFLLGFIASGFNVSVVLVAYTKAVDGGLELPPQQIGFALSIMGGLSILLKFSLTWILRPSPNSIHPVSHKLMSVFAKTMRTWPAAFAGFVVLGWVARGKDDSMVNGLMWLVLSCVLFLSRIGCMPFTLIMMLVKENTPVPESLGALNGLTEFVQAFSFVISPSLISSLFAFSISHHVLGGYLWVVLYVFCSLVGAVVAGRLEKQQRSKMYLSLEP